MPKGSKISKLDELTPKSIPSRVTGWTFPAAKIPDTERAGLLVEAAAMARNVVYQQWFNHGYVMVLSICLSISSITKLK